MLRKNGNLGELSSVGGMLTVCAEGQFKNLTGKQIQIDKNRKIKNEAEINSNSCILNDEV